ncbi:hypothetical protein [Nonomuraea typhae]|uniref:DUF1905 domain-containing protein n=1 Tax=Nonomuraea typhae TaxID=2603600 RepID=A0ABW7YLT8_9ACTN
MADAKIACANEDHPRPTPAVARLSWPDGRYNDSAVCVGDLTWSVRNSLDEGHTVLVEPVAERETGGYVRYTVTHQVKELARIHRRERGRKVRAILLEAPDMPGYDELPETIEERRKLPARFHVPVWDGDGKPNSWLCAVCWEDGVVYGWPCEVAQEYGGEVFAR